MVRVVSLPHVLGNVRSTVQGNVWPDVLRNALDHGRLNTWILVQVFGRCTVGTPGVETSGDTYVPRGGCTVDTR